MTIALAVVWPPKQGGPPSAEHFRDQVRRVEELLELGVLPGFAEMPERDLRDLRQLLGVLDRLVEEVLGTWNEYRTWSDILE